MNTDTGSSWPQLVGELLDRCRFPAPGTAVECAVSGGADSSALLVLACASGCVVTAVHVDHGLRPESAGEADVVAALAERYGAGMRRARADVEPGPNLEARARAARYAVLSPDAMTGHTADDQAETVLLNLMRGAGVTGLAGIRADARRPILNLRRSETSRLCADLGLAVVEDPSNRDPRFRRNRVRHELLPLFDDIAERDVAGVVARQAQSLAEIDQYLRDLASSIDVTDARALAAAPDVLARVAVRRWLTEHRPGSAGEHPPDAAAVERVLAVAHGFATGTEVGGGWSVKRTDWRLRLVSGPESDPKERD